MEKQLGRIRSVTFGSGGYQDAMIGITFDLGGEGWGIGDFWGHWSSKPSSGAKWTEAEQVKYLGEVVMRISTLLTSAKVSDISKLKGVPVEVITENNSLKSWRVLKEVL
jgi:hypothetical protein